MTEKVATVLIVGRPNSGKSTLFNKLLQRKVSPTTARAGMTQDWIEEALELDNLPLMLLDSAGADFAREGDPAWRKTLRLIEEAALILFVLDAQTELTAIEHDLAKCLRGKKVLVIANKGEGMMTTPEPCMQLGFDTPLLLSALHGRGIAVLKDTIKQALLDQGFLEQDPQDAEQDNEEDSEQDNEEDSKEDSKEDSEEDSKEDSEEDSKEDSEEDSEENSEKKESKKKESKKRASPLKDKGSDSSPLFSLALLGRPNSGKSTLANRLLGEERMIVAAEAGTTRNAVRLRWHQQGGYAILVDTAGLRKQSSVRRGAHPIEQESARDALRALRQSSVVALVVEATRPFEKQERTLASRAFKAGKPLLLVANKWDKLSADERKIFARDLEGMLRRLFSDVQGMPVLMVSALYDKDVSVVFSAAQELHDLSTRRIPTARINAWLANAKKDHPPPLQRGRPPAIRYATQIDAAPPRVLLHSNASLPKAYLRYLKASLIRNFDWRGVPVVLEVQTPPPRTPSKKPA